MPKQLSLENAREFAAKVEWEGDVPYVLKNWDFKDEFKDKKFAALRTDYINSLAAVEQYLGLERIQEEE